MKNLLYRRTMKDIEISLRKAREQWKMVPFRQWDGGDVLLLAGERVYHRRALYCVKCDHNTQRDLPPRKATDLYARVLIPIPTIIFDWELPDNDNGYMVGNRVWHSGRIWQSLINNNMQEPGTVGSVMCWVEVPV